MAPVTSAGVAAQTLAEALGGMALAQLVRPGAPVILGSFASSMSMQSGAPTFGTPEPALVLYTMAALARRLGVPFRSGGSLTASKIEDAQAAYESAATLQPTVLGGTNFVLHAAGWLEGGLTIGYEKFVMDADQLGMMGVFVKGVDLSENGQALEAIRQNQPGQHFLGSAHTLANFETAFYRSEIADNNSYEQWLEDGELDARARANKVWKKMLAEYEAPAIDPAVDEALLDFIARRKASMPDAGGVTMPDAAARPGGRPCVGSRCPPAGGGAGRALAMLGRLGVAASAPGPDGGWTPVRIVVHLAAVDDGGLDAPPPPAGRPWPPDMVVDRARPRGPSRSPRPMRPPRRSRPPAPRCCRRVVAMDEAALRCTGIHAKFGELDAAGLVGEVLRHDAEHLASLAEGCGAAVGALAAGAP